MADSSFDIVSKLDHQEVDNALNQAAARDHASASTSRTPAPRSSGPASTAIEISANADDRALRRRSTSSRRS